MDMEIRDWVVPIVVALLCTFGWIPVCWIVARIGGWM